MQVMQLREQLRPYIMERYREASQTGLPVMRPLFVDFWNDTIASLIDDQLMFGPDYLLAPQLEENGTERHV